MIYSFSGTGNSLWAAKELGRLLQMPVESLLRYREDSLNCRQENVVGFVFPTYMGDIPWIVKEIMWKIEISEESYIFLVMTSNNGESGRSFQSIDEILYMRGSHLSAGFNLQMPGNCLISSEKENQMRLENAPAVLKKISGSIQRRERNYKPTGNKPGSRFVENSYFYGTHSLKRLTFMKNFKITKECNGCGVCTEVCPVNNITIKERKAIHGNQCAACYACLHWCPQKATKLKVPTLGNRPQYHHPEITLQDIKRMKGEELHMGRRKK